MILRYRNPPAGAERRPIRLDVFRPTGRHRQQRREESYEGSHKDGHAVSTTFGRY
jgi:hypothetical protein